MGEGQITLSFPKVRLAKNMSFQNKSMALGLNYRASEGLFE